jgi:hypothetical protein
MYKASSRICGEEVGIESNDRNVFVAILTDSDKSAELFCKMDKDFFFSKGVNADVKLNELFFLFSFVNCGLNELIKLIHSLLFGREVEFGV